MQGSWTTSEPCPLEWSWACARLSLLANETHWLLEQHVYLSWDHQWVNPLSPHLGNHSQMSHPRFLGCLTSIIFTEEKAKETFYICEARCSARCCLVHGALVQWMGSPLVNIFPAVTFNTSFFLFLCLLCLKWEKIQTESPSSCMEFFFHLV